MAVAKLRPRNTVPLRLPSGTGAEGPEDVPFESPLAAVEPVQRLLLIGGAVLGIFWAITATNYDRTQWWAAALLLAGVLVIGAVIQGRPRAPWASLGYAIAVGIADRVGRDPFTGTDVRIANEEALAVLARFENPYGYRFSSAEGMIPYPPGELFFYAIPRALFGGIDRTDQWAGIGIVLLLAALAPFVGPARAALATSLYATFGFASHLAMDGSNDTGLAFLLVLGTVLLTGSEVGGRRRGLVLVLFYASAVAFAWALLFKQFAWLLYPFVVLYLRRRGDAWRRHAGVTVGAAILVMLPFAVTEPAGFKRNLVDIAYVHQDVWGLNLWAGLHDLAPGLVDAIDPAIPMLNVVAVAAVGLALVRRPVASLGLALLQGLALLFVALFLARWTTAPYYTGAGAVLAAAVALVPIPPLAAPSRRPRPLIPRRPIRFLAPELASGAALTVGLVVLLLGWSAGWFTANQAAGEPFAITPPTATMVEGRISVATSFTARAAEQLRGWFFLAPAGETEPWANHRFKSDIIDQAVAPGRPTIFHWSEAVDVPDGLYDVTIWFHHRNGGTWTHLVGGGFGTEPLVVRNGSATDVGGPFRLGVEALPLRLRAGRDNPVALTILGTAEAVCRMRWQLFAPAGGEMVAAGPAGPCTATRLVVPASLAPGDYVLKMTALAVTPESITLSDRLTVPVVVSS